MPRSPTPSLILVSELDPALFQPRGGSLWRSHVLDPAPGPEPGPGQAWAQVNPGVAGSPVGFLETPQIHGGARSEAQEKGKRKE